MDEDEAFLISASSSLDIVRWWSAIHTEHRSRSDFGMEVDVRLGKNCFWIVGLSAQTWHRPTWQEKEAQDMTLRAGSLKQKQHGLADEDALPLGGTPGSDGGFSPSDDELIPEEKGDSRLLPLPFLRLDAEKSYWPLLFTPR